ncbi:SMR family transporter [Brevibacterium sp. RIT 803]|uniref:DMT family transporter n=1 Tax=Brevibacterium sp. RIT 803 TaxID=2810210 RepID=UPI00194DBF77|nr:SMR family transporter [Brevibacterium sp. RIT 803]MBM6591609.1 QacE family quaternary ammonium compound efflux SMR transporter [Brevibacterium sp. RIT 803]
MISAAALTGAVITEVAGTLSLRAAVQGTRAWYIAAVASYLVAFTLLTVCLAQGMALGVAYGIWTAAGVVVTAILSRWLFQEPLTVVMAAGMALVVGGVLFVELGAAH